MAAEVSDIQGIYILTLDTNKDILPWAFPSLDPTLAAVLTARSCLQDGATFDQLLISRFGGEWQYILNTAVPPDSPAAAAGKVTAAALIIRATSYNVLKFEALLRVLLRRYLAGDSAAVVQNFLILQAAGKLTQRNNDGTRETLWEASAFDPRSSLIGPAHVVTELFGVETAAIWVAMLTKQRVFVHHTDPVQLCAIVRALPSFGAWHRQAWGALHPLCTPAAPELADLKAAGTYVAGFVSPAAQEQTELWDLFLDVPARSVIVSDKARGRFAMGKFHKQVAEAGMRAAEGAAAQAEDPAQAVIKSFLVKTKELVDQLALLKSQLPAGAPLTVAELQKNKVPASLEGFFLDVASAEGLTR